MNSDWRPKLTAQADGWEAEADKREAAIKEGNQAAEVPVFLKIEIDLGLLLIKMDKMKVKVEQQIKEWDKTGDGTISKGEFRLHLRSLGLENATTEVDELFDKYDSEFVQLLLTHKPWNALCTASVALTLPDSIALTAALVRQPRRHSGLDRVEARLEAIEECNSNALSRT